MKLKIGKLATRKNVLHLIRSFCVYSVLAIAVIYAVNYWPFGEIRAVYERY